MPKFSITATVRQTDGSTREVSGTVENASPLYTHHKAQADAANQLAKVIAPGESFDAGEIQVRYSRHQ